MIETEVPPRAAPDPPARRRRRRLVSTLGGLAIVVVLLFVAAALYAGRYDPLCREYCGGIGGASGATTTDMGNFTAPTGESFEAYRVRWRPGGTFQFWFSLSMDGRFPVTITRIGAPSPSEAWPGPYLRVTGVTVSHEEHPDTHSFRPFTLPRSGPDAIMDVHVTMAMRGCLPGSAGATCAPGS